MMSSDDEHKRVEEMEADNDNTTSNTSNNEEEVSEASSLDEDDRELIEENLRKRPAHGPTPLSKKPTVSLENLFDDDEEEEAVPAVAADKKRLSMDDDDLEDFIVSDDEDKKSEDSSADEEKVEQKKVKRPVQKRVVRKPAARTFSNVKVSNDVYYDLMEVFGDPRDYQDMLDSFSATRITPDSTKAVIVEEEDIESDLSEEDSFKDKVEFIMQELELEEGLREDVELVLKYIVEDQLEVIYLEAYQQDLSLDGETLWAIFDAHLQWKESILKARRKCRRHNIPVDGLFAFDTLSDYISKFASASSNSSSTTRTSNTTRTRKSGVLWGEAEAREFGEKMPDPVELQVILSAGSFYEEPAGVSEEMQEYAAWRYALHPVTFQFFLQHSNEDISLRIQQEGILRNVIQRAQGYAAAFIKRRQATLEAKRNYRLGEKKAVRDLQRLISLRALRVEGEEQIGVVMIHGNRSACALMDVRTGNPTKTFKSPVQEQHYFEQVQKIVIGGRGPQVRTVFEALSKRWSCYLVKPLPGTEELDCQSLGRFAVDPALEIVSRHSRLAELLRLPKEEEERYQRHLHRALVRFVAAKGVNLEECFVSEWKRQPLLLLPGMTVELAEALEGVKSREQLRGMMSDRSFRNLAGFLTIPSSKEPLDATLAHPDTRHPSMLTPPNDADDDDSISVMASGEQMMEMIMEDRLHRGKVFSGPVVRNDYPHSLLIKLANGVEAVIKGPRSRVPPGQVASGEFVRVDADRFRLELNPTGASGTGGEEAATTPSKEAPIVQQTLARVAMHPLFREISGRQAEDSFRGIGLVGDVIVRPSRQPGHLSISWKVSSTLTQHLDVEIHRTTGKLMVTGVACDDVDEIVARMVDPLAQLVDTILACPKYFEFGEDGERTAVEEHLKKGFVDGRIAYCVWLSREEPGALMHISSLPTANLPVKHENVRLLLRGRLQLREREFDSLEKMISHWKAEYAKKLKGK